VTLRPPRDRERHRPIEDDEVDRLVAEAKLADGPQRHRVALEKPSARLIDQVGCDRPRA
jgi:hypothetical protein